MEFWNFLIGDSTFWRFVGNISALVGLVVLFPFGLIKGKIATVSLYRKLRKLFAKSESESNIAVVTVGVNIDQTVILNAVNNYYNQHPEYHVGTKDPTTSVIAYSHLIKIPFARLMPDSEGSDSMEREALECRMEFDKQLKQLQEPEHQSATIIHFFYAGPAALLPILTWGLPNQREVVFFHFDTTNNTYYRLGQALKNY